MLQIIRRSVAVLIAVCAVVQIDSHIPVRASSSGMVISQVYGGGGNSGATLKNDFIELFNAGGSPVDVTGWSVQYASSAGTSWQKTSLTGVIQAGHYYLVQEAQGAGGTTPLPTPDAIGTIPMSASAGKVALVTNSTTLSGSCPLASVLDFVGFGTANCFETSPTAALSNTTAAIRNNGGVTDTDNNSADFTVGAPTPRNSACSLVDGCPITTNPVISAPPITVVQGDPILLTVSVIPGANPTSTGIVVTGDLTAIGQGLQAFYDDGAHGDVTPGDRVFSLAVPAIASASTYSFTMNASDAQSRSATPATLQLTVAALTPIHDIQGPGTVSPFVGQKVTTRGIVTGVKYNGFFIQAPDSEADADPNTSEGVFVYTSTTPPAAAVVGNRVQVAATVSEFKSTSTDPDGLSMTELIGPVTTLLSTGNPLPAAVTLTASDLNPGASISGLEKYEGMRVHIDQVVSTSGTGGTLDEPDATAISSGVFVGVLPGTGRPFREAGIETPLPVPPEAPAGATPPVFDANPERIAVDTFSVFLDPATAAIYPPPPGTTLEVTTGVTVANITGPLDYAYRFYMVDAEGWNMPTATTANATVQSVRLRTNDEFTVATANLARFFDTTDDPATSDAVLTAPAFALRLGKASLMIRTVLQAPDIIGVEEVENLTTLQAIAQKVYDDSLGAIDYAAYLMEGNDIGGIDVGFLVRKDKVSVGTVDQVGKDTIFPLDNSLLNDRPSLVMRASILNAPYDPYPVTVVVNHLRSLSGIEGSDATGARVRAKRLAQAVELGGKLQALQSAGDAVISVGDYNAYEVNDGYVDVIGYLVGAEAPSNKVTEWAPSPVSPVFFDVVDLAPAEQRYSYVFDGNAQEIDHILISSSVKANSVGYGRVNADFPVSLRGDATRPERLSDHDPIVGYFNLPDIDQTPPTLTLPSSMTAEGNAFGGAIVTYTATAYDAVDGAISPVCAPASGALFPLKTTTVMCTAVDAHGNRASGSFDVTVKDTTAPVINGVTATPSTLWEPNHKFAPVVVTVTVSDLVDPAPSCGITGVTANDGATSADWQVTGPLTLGLRAERSGGGSGRTYTIGIDCADASGNATLPASVDVKVPHDQRK